MFARSVLVAMAIVVWSVAPRARQVVPSEPPAGDGGIVVTASRTEERLINAPVAMTVIPESLIDGAPSLDIADLLRMVPGLNVVQASARDINVASREATGTLADSTPREWADLGDL